MPEIADFLDLHPATVRSYIKRFQAGGFEGLKAAHRSGRPAKLSWTKAQWDDLLAQAPSDFEKLNSGAKNWTQELLRQYFKHYQEVVISQPTLAQTLKAAGIRWRRARLRIHSPDPLYLVKRERVEGLRQMALTGELSTTHATDPPPKRRGQQAYLAYFDAADLHWCPDVGAIYNTRGQQVKVDSPGKNNPWYALFGSLIYPSGDGHYTIHERKRSDDVVAHLQGLIDRDPDGFWFVILDNATAHHAPQIKAFLDAHQHRIELVYLPTYSPHLNLIERLWRFMRHQVTRNRFFESLDDLAKAVQVWLERLSFDHFCSIMGVDENALQFV